MITMEVPFGTWQVHAPEHERGWTRKSLLNIGSAGIIMKKNASVRMKWQPGSATAAATTDPYGRRATPHSRRGAGIHPANSSPSSAAIKPEHSALG